MATMVYIREIHPRTFLHFSTSKEGFCLRDYSQPGPAIELARQSGNRTASTIREMAKNQGNYLIELSGQGKGIEDNGFWHKETLRLNEQFVDAPELPASAHSTELRLSKRLADIIVGVLTAIIIAAILAWLGLK